MCSTVAKAVQAAGGEQALSLAQLAIAPLLPLARRPDVLPPAVMGELAKLQDKVGVLLRKQLSILPAQRSSLGCVAVTRYSMPPQLRSTLRTTIVAANLTQHQNHQTNPTICPQIEPFSTLEARIVVEQELGAPIEELFSEFSAEPIAAASLAQVRTFIPFRTVP